MHQRVVAGVDQAIKDKKSAKSPEWSLKKKSLAIAAAVAIVIAVFVGSAFISPAMAEVASKIPNFNRIFHSKNILTVITNDLKAKHYQIEGTGIRYSPRKEIGVWVDGSEQYFNQVKEDIKAQVEQIMESRGYDAFVVRVERKRDISKIEKNPSMDKTSKALMEIQVELQKYPNV
ncbi:hypothetical protein [Sporolactobacillus nakayamae]|uniref:DUF4179 domain-containing protein n=1 Tax=Sporolactobacillus nakayamae TaxID=269670 RepID=A0A1I2V836_9BACL|nr:hypothetical protein [Sporolactobacillus nakayamae]SFG83546.1 hypothetical protein SAMN02982927_02926 [Sporolactobacillus nakayamae]